MWWTRRTRGVSAYGLRERDSDMRACCPRHRNGRTSEYRQPARARERPPRDGLRGAEQRPFARIHNSARHSAPCAEIASLYGSTGDRPPCRGGVGRPSGRRIAPRTGRAAAGRCWPAGGGVAPVLSGLGHISMWPPVVRAGPHQHVATMRWRAGGGQAEVLVALVRDHSAPPRIRSGAAAPRSPSHSRERGAPLRAHRTARIRWQRSRAERLWSFILYFGWRDLPL